METALLLQPDIQSLSSGLRSVLDVSNAGELTILDRERNAYASGSLSEIVTCGLADGRTLRLLFKYARHPDATRYRQQADEQFTVQSWSNVPYEAEVYRHVLKPLQLSTPRFYGTYEEPGTGRLWLVLEYFADAVPFDELAESCYLRLAASWLGRFHAAAERHPAATSLPFLRRRDAAYYADYAKQALLYAGPVRRSLSWLPQLCWMFENLITSVWTLRPTIVHGDYYRHNILFCDGTVHPVDWEDAAIDLGEMDLARLTDGWPANIRRSCEAEYQKARWPQGAPEDFERVLDTARLCLYFYEAGILPNWTTRNQGARLREKLRSLGKRLELI
jgi:aminoglycoside phosphotransferase (APT) family kinase protein